MSGEEGRFCLPWWKSISVKRFVFGLTGRGRRTSERQHMECEFQDSYGFLENEVTLVMSRDELRQLRLSASLAQVYLPNHDILRDFLGATD